jgi:hypothetical protein
MRVSYDLPNFRRYINSILPVERRNLTELEPLQDKMIARANSLIAVLPEDKRRPLVVLETDNSGWSPTFFRKKKVET